MGGAASKLSREQQMLAAAGATAAVIGATLLARSHLYKEVKEPASVASPAPQTAESAPSAKVAGAAEESGKASPPAKQQPEPPPPSFRVQYTKEKGRHIVADRDIPAGEFVLASPAFAAIVDDDWLAWTCHQCFKPLKPDQQGQFVCGHSNGIACYCSQGCMNNHASVAAMEGPVLKWLKTMGILSGSSILRLSLRCLVVAFLEHEHSPDGGEVRTSDDQTIPTINASPDFADVQCLVANVSAFSDTKKEAMAKIAQALSKLLKDKALVGYKAQKGGRTCDEDYAQRLFSVDQIIHMVCSLQCNAHAIFDSTNEAIALGIFPLAAMVNHSCRPNCTYFHNSDTMLVRTLTGVKAGDELNISYIGIYSPREMRMERLLDKYYFTCQCRRCSAPFQFSDDVKLCGQLDPEQLSDVDEPLFRPMRQQQQGTTPAPTPDAKAGSELPKSPPAGLTFHCGESRRTSDEICLLNVTAVERHAACDEAMQSGDRSKARTLYKELLAEFTPLLHPLHHVMFHSNRVLSALHEDQEEANPHSVILHCRYVIDCMRQVYPSNHPDIAAHYQAIGKAFIHLAMDTTLPGPERKKHLSEAKTALKECFTIMRVCRGVKHPASQAVLNMLKGLLSTN